MKLGKYFWISLLVLVFTILYSFVSIAKHYHFQTFGWDTAVFDQQIHFVSQFRPPYSSLMKMNDLGDHFQLITVITGAISYWIWENVNSLFILQALLGCLSAFPLYLISVSLLRRTKLSEIKITALSLVVALSYLVSVPFQSMLMDEFHNEPIIAAPLIFIVYFLIQKNWLGYWISFIIFILNKEMLGLMGMPIAIYTYLKSRNILHSVSVLLVGVGTTLILIFYLMPIISGTGRYVHFKVGNNPTHLTSKFISNPTLFVSEFVDTPEKRTTITASLFAFGFLPLLAPSELILPIFSLAIRFYDDSSTRLHAFNNHYAVPFLPLLAISMVFGIFWLSKQLEKKGLLKKYWWVLGAYLLLFAMLQNYIYHGPVNSVFKPSFYVVQQWERDAHELIKQVPDYVTIATQNSLLPHLSERDSFYLLPEIGGAEYIAVDLNDGPNKFSPLTQTETALMIDKLVSDGGYKVVWQQNKSMLLKAK